MTPNDEAWLKEIEARANAVTPGKWRAYAEAPGEILGVMTSEEPFFLPQTIADCEFIAHARTDIPRLIAAIRERDARIEKLVEMEELLVTALRQAINAAGFVQTSLIEYERNKALEGDEVGG